MLTVPAANTTANTIPSSFPTIIYAENLANIKQEHTAAASPNSAAQPITTLTNAK